MDGLFRRLGKQEMIYHTKSGVLVWASC